METRFAVTYGGKEFYQYATPSTNALLNLERLRINFRDEVISTGIKPEDFVHWFEKFVENNPLEYSKVIVDAIFIPRMPNNEKMSTFMEADIFSEEEQEAIYDGVQVFLDLLQKKNLSPVTGTKSLVKPTAPKRKAARK